jgi:hypothetical protein
MISLSGNQLKIISDFTTAMLFSQIQTVIFPLHIFMVISTTATLILYSNFRIVMIVITKVIYTSFVYIPTKESDPFDVDFDESPDPFTYRDDERQRQLSFSEDEAEVL